MKSREKLTAANIKTLSPPLGKTEKLYYDTEIPGFALRVRASNVAGEPDSRSFIFSYSRPGGTSKSPKMTIGRVGAIDIADARKVAKKLYGRLQNGEDPAREKAETRIKAAETFGALVPRFLSHQRGRLRPGSYIDQERHLLVYAKNDLHPLPIEKIARRNIATLLEAVAEEKGQPTSNRLRTSLSRFFAWSMAHGLVEHNPVIGTIVQREQPRERVLSPDELRILWNNLADNHYGAILKLLLLTGQRANEIAGLRWSEIKDSTIYLPAERTKNKRSHSVPLSPAALAIIEAQPRRVLRDLIFGEADGPFSGWTQCQNRVNAKIEAQGKGLPHWTPHDLRRSFATHSAELGIQPHLIEAVLNHISGHKGGVAGIYNRASYDREKRIALDRWAEWLLAVVEGRQSNIIQQPA